MLIETVYLKNFGPFEEAHFNCTDQGLILVEGENYDLNGGSNGSGKSTLVADSISWCLFGKTLRGTSHDRVIRANSTGGTEVRVAMTSFEQKLVISRYRKHQKFGNSVIIHQNGKDITPSTDPDSFIEGLIRSDLDLWQYTTSLGQGLAYRFSQLTDSHRLHLLESILDLKQYDNARSYAMGKRDKADTDVKEHNIRVEGLNAQIKSLTDSRDDADKQLKLLRASVKACDKSALSERQAELRQIVLDITAANANKKANSDKIRRLEEEYNNLVRDVARYTGEHAQAVQDASRDAQILEALQVDLCSQCGERLSNAAKERLSGKQVEEAEKHRKSLKSALDSLGQARKDRDERKSDVQMAKEERKVCEKACEDLDTKRRLKEVEIAKLNNIGPSQESLDNAEANLKRAETALEDVKEQLDEVQRTLSGDQRASRIWTVITDSLARIRQQALQKAVEFLSARFSYYAGELFGRPMQAVVELETKNISTGISSKVVIKASTPGGGYETASGGERDRLDIAMAFALHDLVTASSGFKSNVLIADEIGSFIDADGIEKLVGLLRQKAEQVGTVFCMTQNAAWGGYIDSSWKVEKKEGVATLIGYRS